MIKFQIYIVAKDFKEAEKAQQYAKEQYGINVKNFKIG